MSGRDGIEALRRGGAWARPVLLPSAVRLGARLEAQRAGERSADPQKLADACLSAARYLGADGVWIPALAMDGEDEPELALVLDAATRAFAVARPAIGCVIELRGPLARALAVGGDEDIEAAIRAIKPGMIADFEAVAALRPDIIVLSEPASAPAAHGENRSLARLYGALKRLAEHFDILAGMKSAPLGMAGPAAPDLIFAATEAPVTGERAICIAPDWQRPEAFATAVIGAQGAARRNGLPLVVSTWSSLDGETEPQIFRDAAGILREYA